MNVSLGGKSSITGEFEIYLIFGWSFQKHDSRMPESFCDPSKEHGGAFRQMNAAVAAHQKIVKYRNLPIGELAMSAAAFYPESDAATSSTEAAK